MRHLTAGQMRTLMSIRVLNSAPKVYLNEIYTAAQGEGPRLGTPSIFVRLHGCPVHCKWCDTAYTWDGSEKGEWLSVDELVRRVGRYSDCRLMDIKHVVLTGGEPTASKALPEIVKSLIEDGYSVDLETAGVLDIDVDDRRFDGALWVVSPKMSSANPKMKPDVKILASMLLKRDCSSVLKIVVADDSDYEEAIDLCDEIASQIRKLGGPGLVEYILGRLYLMPCGITRKEVADNLVWLLDRAKPDGLKVTTRMHVLAYGDQRGK